MQEVLHLISSAEKKWNNRITVMKACEHPKNITSTTLETLWMSYAPWPQDDTICAVKDARSISAQARKKRIKQFTKFKSYENSQRPVFSSLIILLPDKGRCFRIALATKPWLWSWLDFHNQGFVGLSRTFGYLKNALLWRKWCRRWTVTHSLVRTNLNNWFFFLQT